MTIQRATKLAQESLFDRARIGCVIVKKNKILGQGFNKVNRHTSRIKHNSYPGSLHAETAAVLDALRNGRNLKGSTVFVSRVMADGKTGMACPCESCANVLKSAGIKKIVFTTNIGGIGEILV